MSEQQKHDQYTVKELPNGEVWIQCGALFEKGELKEICIAAFSFELSNIKNFRQSLDDDGKDEEYTIIDGMGMNATCIDIEYFEFKKLFFSYKMKNINIIPDPKTSKGK